MKRQIKNTVKRCAYSGKLVKNKKVVLQDLAVEFVKKQGYIVISPREKKLRQVLLPTFVFIIFLSAIIPFIQSDIYSDCSIYGTCQDFTSSVNNSNINITVGSNLSGGGTPPQIAIWNGTTSLNGNSTFFKNNTGVFITNPVAGGLGQRLTFIGNSSLYGNTSGNIGLVADNQIFQLNSDRVVHLRSSAYVSSADYWRFESPVQYARTLYDESQSIDFSVPTIFPYVELSADSDVVDIDITGCNQGQTFFLHTSNVDFGTPNIIGTGGSTTFFYVDHATGTESTGTTLTMNNPGSFVSAMCLDSSFIHILYYYDVTIT